MVVGCKRISYILGDKLKYADIGEWAMVAFGKQFILGHALGML
jgi:hypothetical protein